MSSCQSSLVDCQLTFDGALSLPLSLTLSRTLSLSFVAVHFNSCHSSFVSCLSLLLIVGHHLPPSLFLPLSLSLSLRCHCHCIAVAIVIVIVIVIVTVSVVAHCAESFYRRCPPSSFPAPPLFTLPCSPSPFTLLALPLLRLFLLLLLLLLPFLLLLLLRLGRSSLVSYDRTIANWIGHCT